MFVYKNKQARVLGFILGVILIVFAFIWLFRAYRFIDQLERWQALCLDLLILMTAAFGSITVLHALLYNILLKSKLWWKKKDNPESCPKPITKPAEEA